MKNKGFRWMREEGSAIGWTREEGRVGWTTVKIRVDKEVRREGHHHRSKKRNGPSYEKDFCKGFLERI